MFLRTESFSQFIRYYPIITIIITIHILAYILLFIPFFPSIAFYQTFAGTNIYIANGEWWRLFSPIFLHSSFAHLFFNSISLIIFGPPLEKILTKYPFLFLYICSGIIGNIATFLLMPATYSHIGSSGAIFGLFGTYFSLYLFKSSLITNEHKKVILPIIILAGIMTFGQPNINFISHLSGFIAGVAFGYFYTSRRKPTF
ncbi:membrane associated rhomboid family serine protease [Oikeobacillus pervagus]|uniref:Membrane associated rhomboid family serine protease n=1 Tax=Oikeobacillus pervagus TaxID=1325931 RepID=A0AAJ1WKB8_9BACI|nr:rhomboid family intramembrane serine protease [Oikeobacillus pervagus]MDQ0216585.1 membrane associated rhomboid family serine protease [Oikeobacillus pervagus]